MLSAGLNSQEQQMKKKIGSLRLTRETVTRLTSEEMQGAVAGVTRATLCTCNITAVTCACSNGC
jgi:hypothetical protein